MLKIEQVIKQDRLLRALTGLNRKAFESLLPTFNEFYEQTIKEHQKQPRQRAVGGGVESSPRGRSRQIVLHLIRFQMLSDIRFSRIYLWGASFCGT